MSKALIRLLLHNCSSLFVLVVLSGALTIVVMSVEVSDVNLMESPPDKVVLVGDVGVGKTSLFLRFKTGEFSESTSHNPREGEFHKKWQVDGSEVSVSV